MCVGGGSFSIHGLRLPYTFWHATRKTYPFSYCTCCWPAMHRCPYRITLQLLDSPNGGGHYVWVKSLLRLITSKFTHKSSRYVCMSCLQAFSTKRILDAHETHCLVHAPQQCIHHTGDRAKLSFVKDGFEFPYDFYLVADFECFLVPHKDPLIDSTHVVGILRVSGDMARRLLQCTVHLLWQKRHGEILQTRVRRSNIYQGSSFLRRRNETIKRR